MKTKKYITLGAVALGMTLTMASCGDSFLEITNPTGENLEEYYTTDQHINEALNAAYDPLHWPDWGLDQYNALNIDAEILGDDFWVGGKDKADMLNWKKLFNYEGDASNTLNSLWTVDYSGVKRCNDLLKYLGYAEDNLTAENKTSYEMQARGLRVYYYNNLWHYFGNIPFYLVNLTSPYTAPQLSADEVYNNLITELEEVIKSNALPMRWDDENAGRVSQAMCYMMYAEMVMYQNDESRYAQALQYMKDIIADKSDYDLVQDFSSIWKETGEWCKESIWEINYESRISERDWGGAALNVGGTVLPTLISPNTWPGGDGWSQGKDGWGFLPVRLETYNLFANNDKRRDATIWDTRGVTYTERYQDTHLWLAKYRPFDENNITPTSANLNYNNNYRVYRMSEAYLNAAELLLRTNGSGADAAREYVNPIRRRAGITELSSVTIDDVINERHLEFIGEGKRYFDLVRTGKAASVLVPDSYGYRTNAWTPGKKYIPIAQAELDSDPALKQNTDYFK